MAGSAEKQNPGVSRGFAFVCAIMPYYWFGALGAFDGDGEEGAGAGVIGLGAEPVVDGMLRVAGVDISRFAAVCVSSRPGVKARNNTTTAKIAAATQPHVAFDAMESSGGRFCSLSRFSGSLGS